MSEKKPEQPIKNAPGSLTGRETETESYVQSAANKPRREAVERELDDFMKSQENPPAANAYALETARLQAQIEVYLTDIQRLRAENDAMIPRVQQAMAALRAI